MERQRYEVTLRCGGGDSVMWTNRLCELAPIARLAITGSQSDWRMGCAVRDTATGARAEIVAPTPVGFTEAVFAMWEALEKTRTRSPRPEEGRDVVVEVQFAAHGATLEDCRSFASAALWAALSPEDQTQRDTKFSPNGDGVGEAWFQ